MIIQWLISFSLSLEDLLDYICFPPFNLNMLLAAFSVHYFPFRYLNSPLPLPMNTFKLYSNIFILAKVILKCVCANGLWVPKLCVYFCREWI